MREKLRDPQRLEHILENINNLIEIDKNGELDEIQEKSLSYFGIIKLLEIIGEAAFKLTNEFKESHSSTPWKFIVGMRHILVHGYYQVNFQDVRKTIKEDLPSLKVQIQEYINELSDNSQDIKL